MKEILVFSAGRSDFGILKKLLIKLESDRKINLNLILGPAHNAKVFGLTGKESRFIKAKKKFFYRNLNQDSSGFGIIRSMARLLDLIVKYLSKRKFDAAIVLGDRYEMLVFSLCCFNLKIPIIHLGGGSITAGSLDDTYRKCISQMSNMHFVETAEHKKNLIKLNIKKNIFISGALALEDINKYQNLHKLFENEFKNYLNSKKKKLLCCFHPETNLSKADNIENLKNFISFLNQSGQKILFTYPNADEGYLDYIKIIKDKLNRDNSLIVKNLGIEKYHFILNKSDLVLGNSSSGIIETCSFKKPCINLGNRQKNRLFPKNVIHSSFKIKDIKKNFKKSISKSFLQNLTNIKNPYEKKNPSDFILKNIKNMLLKIS